MPRPTSRPRTESARTLAGFRGPFLGGPATPAPPFQATVLAVVRRIPPGRVSTYGDVAALAGRPGAARAVGNIMRHCRSLDVPCHRVVAAAGRLGGFAGSVGLKRELLRAEGVRVAGTRVSAFADVCWAPALRRAPRRAG